jgi:cytosine/adenosine deaminase-related metal-dependent hydrolase
VSATVHLAPLVLTSAGPFLRDAAVAVEGGVVTEVGPRGDVVRRHARARLREHSGVLTPGLVNAHAHLEFGPPFADLARAGLPFAEWIAQLGARRRALDPSGWLEAARGSVHQLLRSGTTAVADVVSVGPGLRAAAMASLAGISYVEAVGADDERWPAERARVEQLLAVPSREVGLSPHTLYTLGSAVFRDCADLARSRGLRLHPHLAETADEAELVLSGTGALAAAVTRLGWRLELLEGGAGRTPVQHCADLGVLGPDVHVAHGVHVDAGDRALLREQRTAVALCTRSNAVLRAGEAPVASYLAEGSPVALGIDLEHGAGRCTATAVAGRLVHRR